MSSDVAYEPSLASNLMGAEFLTDLLSRYSIDYGDGMSDERLVGYQIAFVHNSFLRRNDIKQTARLAGDAITSESAVIDDGDAYYEVLSFNPGKSYQCLEFLGDSCIKASLSMYLYLRFPRAKEGFLTTLRIKLECKDNLARFGSHLCFERHLLVNEFIERGGGRQNPRFMEDVFEAFCGALFLDIGYDAVYKLLVGIIEETIDFKTLILNDDNYKSILLKAYHRLKWKTTPAYSVVVTDSNNTCTVCLHYIPAMRSSVPDPVEVTITRLDERGDRVERKQWAIATGTGKTKKEAEQDVSRVAMDILSDLDE